MSFISDFNLPVKKMTSDAKLANQIDDTNYGLISNDYNIVGANIYSRTVTITSPLIFTNYIVCIQLDTRTLYQSDFCTYFCTDFRIFDVNGSPLLFYIENPNSPVTNIFVKFDNLGAGNTDITIQYGNPALPSLSTNAILPNAYFSSVLHLKANDYSSQILADDTNLFSTKTWLNRCIETTNKKIFAYNTSLGNFPLLVQNQANNNSVFRFNTNDWLSCNIFGNFNTSEISVFVVAKGTGSYFGQNDVTVNTSKRRRYQLTSSQWRCGIDTDFINLPSVNTSKFSLVGAISRSNNDHSLISDNTTTTSTTTLPINFYSDRFFNIGRPFGVQTNAESFTGDIAEIIVILGAVSNSGLDNIKQFLNAKYRLYNTGSLPTYSISSQTTITTPTANYSYISYSPYSEYTINTGLDLKTPLAGQANLTSDLNVQNVFKKTIAIGINQENWTNSTQASGDLLICPNYRQLNFNTVGVLDRVSINKIDNNGQNSGDLSKFQYKNELDNSYIESYNDDFIDFDFYIQNINGLDLSNSYILFKNSTNTQGYECSLNYNLNTWSNGYNRVKLQKSNFLNFGGLGWYNSNAFLEVFLKSTGGGQVAYYGYFELIKNFEKDLNVNINSLVKLSPTVSSDNGSTFYQIPAMLGRINSKYITYSEAKINVLDYLEKVKNRKFGDLNAFKTDFILFNCVTQGINPYLTFYQYFLKKLLTLIFPASILDIVIDQIVNTPTSDNGLLNKNFFYIHKNDIIGDVVDSLLKSSFSYLTFDAINQKIIVRSGWRTWTNTNNLLPTPYKIETKFIYKYETDTSKSDLIANQLDLLCLIDERKEFYPIINFIDGTQEIKARSSFTFIFNVEQKDNIYINIIGSVFIGGWNVADSSTSNIFNNANVEITDIRFNSSTIFIDFNNLNTTSVYLRQLNVQADVYILSPISSMYQSSVLYNFSSTITAENTNSKAKYGTNKIDLNVKYSDFYYNSVNKKLVVNNQITEYINKFSQVSNLIKLECQYNPNYRVGLVVSFRSNNGKNIIGHVVSLTIHCENGEYTSVITIREIV